MYNIFPKIKLGRYREEKLDISISAFEAFKRLYGQCENVFLLESLGESGKYNRFSYVGFDPLFTVLAKNGELYIGGKSVKCENAFGVLRLFFSGINKGIRVSKGFAGGLVGYISYEGTQYFEKAFTGDISFDFPNFEFGFYQDGLIFDKKGNHCIYFHHGQSRLNQLLRMIDKSGKLSRFSFNKLEGENKKEHHERMVKAAKIRIQQGDIFQVVLSLKSNYLINGDTRKLYAVLRKVNPAPYMLNFKFNDREILSASPELLIRVKGKNIEHLGTLAGTIRRGESEEEDKILAKILKEDEKEKAEHMMLVDLARNDLGKVCKFGSIKVGKLAQVVTYSFVQHLFTEITGKLAKDMDSFTALSACFPAGTLTGAPKVEAMKIIHELEDGSRGPYGGVGGYFSLNGESMFAILIRSIFMKGNIAYTQTGSGIVLDSDAKREFREVENKQKAMEKALELTSLVHDKPFNNLTI